MPQSPYSLPYSQLETSIPISSPSSDTFYVSTVTQSAAGDGKCHLFSTDYLNLRKTLRFLKFFYFACLYTTHVLLQHPGDSPRTWERIPVPSCLCCRHFPVFPTLDCVSAHPSAPGVMLLKIMTCLTDRAVQGSGKGSAVGTNSWCTQSHRACCLLVAFPWSKSRQRERGRHKPAPAHPLLHPALEIPCFFPSKTDLKLLLSQSYKWCCI